MHGRKRAILTRRPVKIPGIQQVLLCAFIKGSPGGIGFGQAILFAGKGIVAVDLGFTVRGAKGGVAHAELHVAVVPGLVVVGGVAAEIEFEAGACAAETGESADEPGADLEADRLAGEDGCHGEGG